MLMRMPMRTWLRPYQSTPACASATASVTLRSVMSALTFGYRDGLTISRFSIRTLTARRNTTNSPDEDNAIIMTSSSSSSLALTASASASAPARGVFSGRTFFLSHGLRADERRECVRLVEGGGGVIQRHIDVDQCDYVVVDDLPARYREEVKAKRECRVIAPDPIDPATSHYTIYDRVAENLAQATTRIPLVMPIWLSASVAAGRLIDNDDNNDPSNIFRFDPNIDKRELAIEAERYDYGLMTIEQSVEWLPKPIKIATKHERDHVPIGDTVKVFLIAGDVQFSEIMVSGKQPVKHLDSIQLWSAKQWSTTFPSKPVPHRYTQLLLNEHKPIPLTRPFERAWYRILDRTVEPKTGEILYSAEQITKGTIVKGSRVGDQIDSLIPDQIMTVCSLYTIHERSTMDKCAVKHNNFDDLPAYTRLTFHQEDEDGSMLRETMFVDVLEHLEVNDNGVIRRYAGYLNSMPHTIIGIFPFDRLEFTPAHLGEPDPNETT